jgi:hypothetical protein
MTTSGSHISFVDGVSFDFDFGFGVDFLSVYFLDELGFESESGGSSLTFDCDLSVFLLDKVFDFDFARRVGGEEVTGTERENISGVVPVAEDVDCGGLCSCTIGGDMFLLDFDLDFARAGGEGAQF